MDPIISIEQIEREAQLAAQHYANVNEACPYPFTTEAGRIFKQHFEQARAELKALQQGDVALTSSGTSSPSSSAAGA